MGLIPIWTSADTVHSPPLKKFGKLSTAFSRSTILSSIGKEPQRAHLLTFIFLARLFRLRGKKVKMADNEEHVIKPQSTTPVTDTSDWPLLLKNYDKRAHSSQLLPIQYATDPVPLTPL